MSGELIFSYFYGGVIILIGCFSALVLKKQFADPPNQEYKRRKDEK